eukprot:TRINITY_DN111962_c0_g1_i1.p1 TRINITY_DN111962_c0_g1~~TRINITY_DN111962_c0_g1_i1.p1  ORF type:complete len:706 (+),score=170.15 TRINITY_DN111962_c0_g1_i1:93-2210(+)
MAAWAMNGPFRAVSPETSRHTSPPPPAIFGMHQVQKPGAVSPLRPARPAAASPLPAARLASAPTSAVPVIGRPTVAVATSAANAAVKPAAAVRQLSPRALSPQPPSSGSALSGQALAAWPFGASNEDRPAPPHVGASASVQLPMGGSSGRSAQGPPAGMRVVGGSALLPFAGTEPIAAMSGDRLRALSREPAVRYPRSRSPIAEDRPAVNPLMPSLAIAAGGSFRSAASSGDGIVNANKYAWMLPAEGSNRWAANSAPQEELLAPRSASVARRENEDQIASVRTQLPEPRSSSTDRLAEEAKAMEKLMAGATEKIGVLTKKMESLERQLAQEVEQRRLLEDKLTTRVEQKLSGEAVLAEQLQVLTSLTDSLSLKVDNLDEERTQRQQIIEEEKDPCEMPFTSKRDIFGSGNLPGAMSGTGESDSRDMFLSRLDSVERKLEALADVAEAAQALADKRLIEAGQAEKAELSAQMEKFEQDIMTHLEEIKQNCQVKAAVDESKAVAAGAGSADVDPTLLTKVEQLCGHAGATATTIHRTHELMEKLALEATDARQRIMDIARRQSDVDGWAKSNAELQTQLAETSASNAANIQDLRVRLDARISETEAALKGWVEGSLNRKVEGSLRSALAEVGFNSPNASASSLLAAGPSVISRTATPAAGSQSQYTTISTSPLRQCSGRWTESIPQATTVINTNKGQQFLAYRAPS